VKIEEAEKRINTYESRIQVAEEAVTELLKLQIHLHAKLTDLECRSRRENIRIHWVKEGAEESFTLMVCYLEHLLWEDLELQDSSALQVEVAHPALTPKPPSGTPLRSIVAKMDRCLLAPGSGVTENCKSRLFETPEKKGWVSILNRRCRWTGSQQREDRLLTSTAHYGNIF